MVGWDKKPGMSYGDPSWTNFWDDPVIWWDDSFVLNFVIKKSIIF